MPIADSSDVSVLLYIFNSNSNRDTLNIFLYLLLGDKYIVGILSRIIKILSDKAVNFQSGYLYHYAFVMLVGFSILLTYLILY